MAITDLPTPPSRSAPSTFSTLADAFIAALPVFVTEANAQAAALTLAATSSTSTTSVAIGTGSKSLTVDVSKSYQPGMSVKIARTAAPSNWMHGAVTTYNSGTGALVVSVTHILGSGTFTDWTITFSAPMLNLTALAEAINTAYVTVASHATTSAIWAAAGNVINFTGTETITDFPAAGQAGSQRFLICAAACVFTHAGNITVQGGATYTAVAGDVAVVTALSTTTFKVNIIRQTETGTGAAVMATSPTLVTPNLGTPSAAVLTNATGLPTAGLATQVFAAGIGIGGAAADTGGVAFPATAVPSADPNTMDDYEEGTWTPTNANGLNAATGWYTKIGRLVRVVGYVENDNAGITDGVWGGLPFSEANLPGCYPGGIVTYQAETASVVWAVRVINNSTSFQFFLGSTIQTLSGAHNAYFSATYFSA